MNVFTVLCCSVLRREMEEVLKRDYPDARPVFLDSMLHMHPERLHRVMEEALAGLSGHAGLLVYGDCHPYMKDLEKRPLLWRTDGINCADLLLGRELYKRYQKEGAFLFLPEWTKRWREIFQQELGFTDSSLARDFMQENRKNLIYLDTGLLPVPERTLREIAEHFEMPVRVLRVSLDQLRSTVRSAVKQLQRSFPDVH